MPMLPRRLILFIAPLLLAVPLWAVSAAKAQEAAHAVSITSITVEEMHAMLASEEPLVLSLMTSWCGPCKEELRMLNRLYAEFEDRGVEFAGISLDILPAQMEKVLANVPADFPFYWVGEAGMDELNVNAVPQLYLVRDGGVVRKLVGLQEEDELRAMINELVGQDS